MPVHTEHSEHKEATGSGCSKPRKRATDDPDEPDEPPSAHAFRQDDGGGGAPPATATTTTTAATTLTLDASLRAELGRVWNGLIVQLGPQAAASLIMRISQQAGAAGYAAGVMTWYRMESIVASHRVWRDTLRRIAAEVVLPALPALTAEFTSALVAAYAPQDAQERLQEAAAAEAQVQEWLSTPVALTGLAVLAGAYLRQTLTSTPATPAIAPQSTAGRLAVAIPAWGSTAWQWFQAVTTLLAAPDAGNGDATITTQLSMGHLEDGAARFDSVQGSYPASAPRNASVPVTHAAERIGADRMLQCAVDGNSQGQTSVGRLAGGIAGFHAQSDAVAPPLAAGPATCDRFERLRPEAAPNSFIEKIRAQWNESSQRLQAVHVEIAANAADASHACVARFHALVEQTADAPGGAMRAQQSWERLLSEHEKSTLLALIRPSARQETQASCLLPPDIGALFEPAARLFAQGSQDVQDVQGDVVHDLNFFATSAGPERSPSRLTWLTTLPLVNMGYQLLRGAAPVAAENAQELALLGMEGQTGQPGPASAPQFIFTRLSAPGLALLRLARHHMGKLAAAVAAPTVLYVIHEQYESAAAPGPEQERRAQQQAIWNALDSTMPDGNGTILESIVDRLLLEYGDTEKLNEATLESALEAILDQTASPPENAHAAHVSHAAASRVRRDLAPSPSPSPSPAPTVEARLGELVWHALGTNRGAPDLASIASATAQKIPLVVEYRDIEMSAGHAVTDNARSAVGQIRIYRIRQSDRSSPQHLTVESSLPIDRFALDSGLRGSVYLDFSKEQATVTPVTSRRVYIRFPHPQRLPRSSYYPPIRRSKLDTTRLKEFHTYAVGELLELKICGRAQQHVRHLISAFDQGMSDLAALGAPLQARSQDFPQMLATHPMFASEIRIDASTDSSRWELNNRDISVTVEEWPHSEVTLVCNGDLSYRRTASAPTGTLRFLPSVSPAPAVEIAFVSAAVKTIVFRLDDLSGSPGRIVVTGLPDHVDGLARSARAEFSRPDARDVFESYRKNMAVLPGKRYRFPISFSARSQSVWVPDTFSLGTRNRPGIDVSALYSGDPATLPEIRLFLSRTSKESLQCLTLSRTARKNEKFPDFQVIFELEDDVTPVNEVTVRNLLDNILQQIPRMAQNAFDRCFASNNRDIPREQSLDADGWFWTPPVLRIRNELQPGSAPILTHYAPIYLAADILLAPARIKLSEPNHYLVLRALNKPVDVQILSTSADMESPELPRVDVKQLLMTSGPAGLTLTQSVLQGEDSQVSFQLKATGMMLTVRGPQPSIVNIIAHYETLKQRLLNSLDAAHIDSAPTSTSGVWAGEKAGSVLDFFERRSPGELRSAQRTALQKRMTIWLNDESAKYSSIDELAWQSALEQLDRTGDAYALVKRLKTLAWRDSERLPAAQGALEAIEGALLDEVFNALQERPRHPATAQAKADLRVADALKTAFHAPAGETHLIDAHDPVWGKDYRGRQLKRKTDLIAVLARATTDDRSADSGRLHALFEQMLVPEPAVPAENGNEAPAPALPPLPAAAILQFMKRQPTAWGLSAAPAADGGLSSSEALAAGPIALSGHKTTYIAKVPAAEKLLRLPLSLARADIHLLDLRLLLIAGYVVSPIGYPALTEKAMQLAGEPDENALDDDRRLDGIIVSGQSVRTAIFLSGPREVLSGVLASIALQKNEIQTQKMPGHVPSPALFFLSGQGTALGNFIGNRGVSARTPAIGADAADVIIPEASRKLLLKLQQTLKPYLQIITRSPTMAGSLRSEMNEALRKNRAREQDSSKVCVVIYPKNLERLRPDQVSASIPLSKWYLYKDNPAIITRIRRRLMPDPLGGAVPPTNVDITPDQTARLFPCPVDSNAPIDTRNDVLRNDAGREVTLTDIYGMLEYYDPQQTFLDQFRQFWSDPDNRDAATRAADLIFQWQFLTNRGLSRPARQLISAFLSNPTPADGPPVVAATMSLRASAGLFGTQWMEAAQMLVLYRQEDGIHLIWDGVSFAELKDATHARGYLVDQILDDNKRNRLLSHFTAAQRQSLDNYLLGVKGMLSQGSLSSGFDMTGLSELFWMTPAHARSAWMQANLRFNSIPQANEKNVFSRIAQLDLEKQISDAEILLRSSEESQADEQSQAVRTVGPLVYASLLFAPEFAPEILAMYGVAEAKAGLEKIIASDADADKRKGWLQLLSSGIDIMISGMPHVMLESFAGDVDSEKALLNNMRQASDTPLVHELYPAGVPERSAAQIRQDLHQQLADKLFGVPASQPLSPAIQNALQDFIARTELVDGSAELAHEAKLEQFETLRGETQQQINEAMQQLASQNDAIWPACLRSVQTESGEHIRIVPSPEALQNKIDGWHYPVAYVDPPLSGAEIREMPEDFIQVARPDNGFAGYAGKDAVWYDYAQSGVSKKYVRIGGRHIAEVDIVDNCVVWRMSDGSTRPLQQVFRKPSGETYVRLPDVAMSRTGTSVGGDQYLNRLIYAKNEEEFPSGNVPAFKVSSVADIVDKNVELGATVYRSHPAPEHEVLRNGLLRNPAGAARSRDELLTDMIRHTKAAGGSSGKAMSFTTDPYVARRFQKMRVDDTIYAVDISADRENWINVSDLLLKEGPRLVDKGMVTSADWKQAADTLKNSAESEVFYIGMANNGNVPPGRISVFQTPVSSWRHG